MLVQVKIRVQSLATHWQQLSWLSSQLLEALASWYLQSHRSVQEAGVLSFEAARVLGWFAEALAVLAVPVRNSDQIHL